MIELRQELARASAMLDVKRFDEACAWGGMTEAERERRRFLLGEAPPNPATWLEVASAFLRVLGAGEHRHQLFIVVRRFRVRERRELISLS